MKLGCGGKIKPLYSRRISMSERSPETLKISEVPGKNTVENSWALIALIMGDSNLDRRVVRVLSFVSIRLRRPFLSMILLYCIKENGQQQETRNLASIIRARLLGGALNV